MLLKAPKYFLVTFLVVSALMLNGCSGEEVASTTTSPNATVAEANSDTTAQANLASEVKKEAKETVPGMSDLPRLEGEATVVMTINGSPVTVELDGKNAPVTSGNFVDLVQKGFYDGLTFHRVIKDPQPFVAQGGDPKGNGTGGYIANGKERNIPLEIKPEGDEPIVYGKTFKRANIRKQPELQHKAGAIAMARSQNPDSASSQFYFALADLAFLDGDYAVFGKITEGMDVVNKIKQGDKIENAKVTKGAENLKNPG
ncbi:peptidyl-prolyl cis-trans isomerase cyclophilin type peptidyl-prolyl cis-trans isomerase [Calothrix parasitica NIES-267]|uniref:Peptidyl-prolyl cis-trans isomerase n=1 Tax=Calothrix parasitica NIES-267 TaxID=1973488 RepID=A0A1Z4LRI6_9CYAN|nr:peptidyl-prolyl cis-trans isomerase cyclophilin type peptidyl-prolyl cis-trans isomerase [Calothrix parasitica NIES-267]